MTKRIVVKAFGGPFDGTHVSDFDTDYGLLPPNRFIAEMHRTYNAKGIGAALELNLVLPSAAKTQTAATRVIAHQYAIDAAEESQDLLQIRAIYVQGSAKVID